MPPEPAILILGGERLELLPDRALWWPARQAVVLADVHLGKDSVFRRQGLAMPMGGAETDLQRISTLVETRNARRLIVLGDLLHAAPQETETWIPTLLEWRSRHQALELTWLVGNHDRRIQNLAAELRADCLADDSRVGSLNLWHVPSQKTCAPSLAGHWHPVVRLRTGARTRQRLPAFWLAGQRLVLPSFGSLTGGHPVTRNDADRLWVTDGDSVLAL